MVMVKKSSTSKHDPQELVNLRAQVPFFFCFLASKGIGDGGLAHKLRLSSSNPDGA